MNQDIRDLFPAALARTYLNSAAIGPLPTSAVAAVTSQVADVANNGYDSLETKTRSVDGGPPTAAVEHLRQNDVVVSARGASIRIAPHFFNNFTDIERLAACLP